MHRLLGDLQGGGYPGLAGPFDQPARVVDQPPFERLSAAQRTQLRDLLQLALDPAMADLAQARLQAARGYSDPSSWTNLAQAPSGSWYFSGMAATSCASRTRSARYTKRVSLIGRDTL